MTWQEWVVFGIAILGAVGTVVGYIRAYEKRIDRQDITLFGVKGDNGIKGDVERLERWREDFRAELPKQLEEQRHKIINKVTPLIGDLEERVRQVEQRRRQ